MTGYKNARIWTENGFIRGGFSVAEGRFCGVGAERADAVDLGGATVLPGLVDIHVHGCGGAAFSDGDHDGDVRMARALARRGVTSFAPATETLPYDVISAALEAGLRLHKTPVKGAARLLGVNLEGPFFSPAKKGAQNPAYLRDPDFAAFKRLYDDCEGLIRLADVAPELPGGLDFIRAAAACCTVSLAHTDAPYDVARAAFNAGATHVTHLWNAMPRFLSREPGVIGAAAEDARVTAELICDGHHVHPSAVRATFKLFGADRLCLVSDALRCCGLPEGDYDSGGLRVTLRDGVARLADGTIAGAASDLWTDLRNAVAFGVPAEDAVRAATLTPAREIGADDRVGSVADGKFADFVVCDDALDIKAVYIGGERVE